MPVSSADFQEVVEKMMNLEAQMATLFAQNQALQAENVQVKQELSRSTAQPLNFPVVKDLAVGNLIKPWKGEASDVSVEDFLSHADKAAELGGWSEPDKIKLISLKLEGAAAAFLSSSVDLQSPTVTYKEFKDALIERFKSRQPDQFYYAQLQTARQARNETVEAFADRCKKLNLGTIRKHGDARVQQVIQEEADRRLLAAFTSGLHGNVGVQVRYKMPTTFADALHHAVTVSAIDRESKSEAAVFAVQPGGYRCYGCGYTGHFRQNCPKNKRQNKRPPRQDQDRSDTRDRSVRAQTNANSTNRVPTGTAAKPKPWWRNRKNKPSPNANGSTRAPPSNRN